MEKYLVVWPKSKDVVHINYHYTDFGEIIDYLNNVFPNQVFAIDCDIQTDNVVDFIKENEISKVAMMVNYENVESAFKLAGQISDQTKAPVMAYGNLTRVLPQLFLDTPFKAMYYSGDYESGISSFFSGYPDRWQMDGLIKLDGGAAQVCNPGKFISSDEWGYSKPVQVPVFEYDEVKGKTRYVLNISRGCPFGCKHCLIQMVEGKKERRRTVENLDSALADITQCYKHIKIWAANFTLSKKYIHEFCEIMKRYPDVTWECATRLDLIWDDKMLAEMADSGCVQISMGIESIDSGRFIDSKQFSQEVVESIVKKIQKFGIKVKGCIMLGIPGQTKQDIVDTLEFLKKNGIATRPTVFTPYHECQTSKLRDLTKLNRRTYQNTNVEGVSPEQLIELTKRPFEY